jgi:23S rRNA pseudouridine1911/1915/1917 synthase
MILNILYKDATLLALDKPAGIAVFEGANPTVSSLLALQFPELQNLERTGIVHRLDKDTSGVLLVAQDKKTFAFLQKQFQERTIQKTYTALVVGAVQQNQGVIHTLLGRSPADRRKQRAYQLSEQKPGLREAITEYKVIERYQEYTLLELSPKTGRKHQIRAHMVFLNTPLAGDNLYGFKGQQTPKGLQRQFLHASSLELTLENSKRKKIISPLPAELQNVLNGLHPY